MVSLSVGRIYRYEGTVGSLGLSQAWRVIAVEKIEAHR
mgnify:CR=1 FL=1